jgi:hypothetical protein
MERAAQFLDALTRLDELKRLSDEAGASKRAEGVSAGTIDVLRPLAGVGRISSGKVWGIEGEEGIGLLSNGNLLGELELREVNEENAAKAKEEKKGQRTTRSETSSQLWYRKSLTRTSGGRAISLSPWCTRRS